MEFRNHLLSAFEDGDIQALLPSLAEVTLDRGQVLFEPGDPPENVFFPSNAIVSVVTVMEDGSAVETSTIGRESGTPLLNALAGEPSRTRVFAQIPGAAIRMPGRALRARAAASPALSALLMRHAASITFQAEQGVACNILHEASARLARWLLMTQDRTGSRSLPLTQEYMAVMTGVQRTTISAVANQLRAAGLIRYSRGNIDITDRKGLEAAACECYRAVRAAFDDIEAASGGGRRPS
ncbi:MAG TPA: Crp/Fnr family transcriptional regulator [Phenylobacterium sp.]